MLILSVLFAFLSSLILSVGINEYLLYDQNIPNHRFLTFNIHCVRRAVYVDAWYNVFHIFIFMLYIVYTLTNDVN